MKRYWVVAMTLVMASAMTLARAQGKLLVSGSAEEALTAIEHQWAHAYMTNDLRMIDRIFANDYIALDSNGQFQTKAELMDELKFGFVKYSNINTGPLKVRVFGTMAIVVGSNDETSSRMGMDTSGHYVWTDVFMLRDGNWQAVASQGAFVVEEPDFSEAVD